MSSLPDWFIEKIKGRESFRATPYWDHGHYAIGYGSRAQPGDTRIDMAEANRRLLQDLSKAKNIVDGVVPEGTPDGARLALTSLTQNAGDKWVKDGLGDYVRQGNWPAAQARFQMYTKASGRELRGLVDRRTEEARWMTGDTPQEVARAPQQAPQRSPFPEPPSRPPADLTGRGIGDVRRPTTVPRGIENLHPSARAYAEKITADHPGVRFTSGYRDAKVNKSVDGATNSQHLTGRALDIDLSGVPPAQRGAVIDHALANGATGIGHYGGNSIHVDFRPGGRAAWGPSRSRDSLNQTPPWFRERATAHLNGTYKPPSSVVVNAAPGSAAPAPAGPVTSYAPTDVSSVARAPAAQAIQDAVKNQAPAAAPAAPSPFPDPPAPPPAGPSQGATSASSPALTPELPVATGTELGPASAMLATLTQPGLGFDKPAPAAAPFKPPPPAQMAAAPARPAPANAGRPQPRAPQAPTAGGGTSRGADIIKGMGPGGAGLVTFVDPATGREMISGQLNGETIMRDVGPAKGGALPLSPFRGASAPKREAGSSPPARRSEPVSPTPAPKADMYDVASKALAERAALQPPDTIHNDPRMFGGWGNAPVRTEGSFGQLSMPPGDPLPGHMSKLDVSRAPPQWGGGAIAELPMPRDRPVGNVLQSPQQSMLSPINVPLDAPLPRSRPGGIPSAPELAGDLAGPPTPATPAPLTQSSIATPPQPDLSWATGGAPQQPGITPQSIGQFPALTPEQMAQWQFPQLQMSPFAGLGGGFGAGGGFGSSFVSSY